MINTIISLMILIVISKYLQITKCSTEKNCISKVYLETDSCLDNKLMKSNLKIIPTFIGLKYQLTSIFSIK